MQWQAINKSMFYELVDGGSRRYLGWQYIIDGSSNDNSYTMVMIALRTHTESSAITAYCMQLCSTLQMMHIINSVECSSGVFLLL